MSNTKKTAVLVRCMDKRHAGKIVKALRDVVGDYDFYELTDPGGAGLFADLQPDGTEWLLQKVKIALDHLHCTEVFLAVHGSSEGDPKGCGGYVLKGFEKKYSDPETSRGFSVDQLHKAKEFVSKYVSAPVRLFYVTFDTQGENVIGEVA